MMLHITIKKYTYPIAIACILIASILEYSTGITSSHPFFFQPIFRNSDTSFFIGRLIKFSVLIFGFSLGLKFLLSRIGYQVDLKTAVSIYTIFWFLQICIHPIFNLVFIDQFRELSGFKLFWVFDAIEYIFILCGLIYFLRFLKKTYSIKYRRGFFIACFIYVMYFLTLAPFWSISI